MLVVAVARVDVLGVPCSVPWCPVTLLLPRLCRINPRGQPESSGGTSHTRRAAEAGPLTDRLASVTMRVTFNRVAARTAVDSARSTLAALTVSVGTAGLAAAAARPGLLALVDQHAAAVRDSLDGDRRPLTAAALAGYAEGIRAAAVENGWEPPSGPVDWSEPEWPVARLVAVCALARSLPGA